MGAAGAGVLGAGAEAAGAAAFAAGAALDPPMLTPVAAPVKLHIRESRFRPDGPFDPCG